MSTGTISLVATVLNEATTIDRLLESIARQSRPPDEVIVVDGGSTDGTLEKLRAWETRLPLRVLQVPGASISRGRNEAIRAVRGELIAVTDAGVRLDPGWLAHLAAAVRPEVDVVSGFFLPDATSTFERAMGATVLPAAGDLDPATFLPSSRSVLFRRSAWEQVGGYPEWLDYCEDLVFDLALKRAGFRFRLAVDAVVWFRPRGSLAAFFRQYYLYARGDGKANLWSRRHLVRYAAYAAAAVLLSRYRGARWSRALLAVGVALYTRRPYRRLLPLVAEASANERAIALALVPVIRLVGDVAKMTGYPVGVIWRLRRGARRREAVLCA